MSHTKHRFVIIAMIAFPVICNQCLAQTDRHARWTRHFAKGPKAAMTAGTFFGDEGHEEFLGAVSLSDGSIVAYGNSWGPPFPDAPQPQILGFDSFWDCPSHEPGMAFDKSGKMRMPSVKNPNRTGFMAFYSADLARLNKVVRFGWGVAGISSGLQMPDQSFVVAGTCTPAFRAIAKKAEVLNIHPREMNNKYMGPYQYADLELPGDVYVAKYSPNLERLLWVWIFEAHRAAPNKLFVGKDGMVVFDVRGVKGISGDGKKLHTFKTRRMGGSSYVHKFLTVNPKDGSILFGGDSQSRTGREPWRKPILASFDMEGNLKWRLYDFDGPVVGHDRYRLVSDTSTRVATYSEDGKELLLYMWSDGGNTIAMRHPMDLDRGVESAPLGMSLWGANVLSASHLIRFNPETCDNVRHAIWSAYMREKPNSVSVNGVLVLESGELCVWGSSASWLVQTPGAFMETPDKPNGGRGGYFTIFDRTFGNALFSSALPESTVHHMVEGQEGVAVVSVSRAAREPDAKGGNAVPVKMAVQPEFGGGLSDGHILLMRLPSE